MGPLKCEIRTGRLRKDGTGGYRLWVVDASNGEMLARCPQWLNRPDAYLELMAPLTAEFSAFSNYDVRNNYSVSSLGFTLSEPPEPAPEDPAVCVYTDALKDFRWRVLLGGNKVILCSSEGYINPTHCRDMLEKVAGAFGAVFK